VVIGLGGDGGGVAPRAHAFIRNFFALDVAVLQSLNNVTES